MHVWSFMICASRHTVLHICLPVTGYWGGECRDKCGNCFREWFWRRTHPLPSAIGGAAWKWTATWHMIHFQQRKLVSVWWVYKLPGNCIRFVVDLRQLDGLSFVFINGCSSEPWHFDGSCKTQCSSIVGKLPPPPGKHCGTLGRSRMQPCHRNPRQLWLNYASHKILASFFINAATADNVW